MINDYTISGYYLNDYYEKTFTYVVTATSDKQAKFFLKQKIDTDIAISLPQAYRFRRINNNDVFIIVSIDKIESIEKIGKIIQI